jgi:hypothetical protein
MNNLPMEAAICLSCHTADATMTNDAVSRGGYWKCARCGQTWSAVRLATAAAYERWAVARAN